MAVMSKPLLGAFAPLAGTWSVTYTRPLATAGPEYPPPTGLRHLIFGPPLGKVSTMPVSRQTASRLGPSHCGQSSARSVGVAGGLVRTRTAKHSAALTTNGRRILSPPLGELT